MQRLIRMIDLDVESLAREMGMKRQTLYAYTNGTSFLKLDKLCFLVNEYNLNANWLLTGEGEMFRSREARSGPGPGEEGGPALRHADLVSEYVSGYVRDLSPLTRIESALRHVLAPLVSGEELQSRREAVLEKDSESPDPGPLHEQAAKELLELKAEQEILGLDPLEYLPMYRHVLRKHYGGTGGGTAGSFPARDSPPKEEQDSKRQRDGTTNSTD